MGVGCFPDKAVVVYIKLSSLRRQVRTCRLLFASMMTMGRQSGAFLQLQPPRNITDFVIKWRCGGGYDRTAVAGSKKTERVESAAGGSAARRVSNLPLPYGKRETARAGEIGGQGRSRLRIV